MRVTVSLNSKCFPHCPRRKGSLGGSAAAPRPRFPLIACKTVPNRILSVSNGLKPSLQVPDHSVWWVSDRQFYGSSSCISVKPRHAAPPFETVVAPCEGIFYKIFNSILTQARGFHPSHILPAFSSSRLRHIVCALPRDI